LAHTHSKGVIHRDLKPANVLTGEFGATYLIDWGLAKVWGEPDPRPTGTQESNDPTLTPPGRRYGTPLYMAPEIAKGESHVDARTDVFGLGHILFEILTHRQIIQGQDIKEVKTNLLEKPFPNPREVAPDKEIPPQLEEICLKALQKDRRQRYPSVDSMMDELLAYID